MDMDIEVLSEALRTTQAEAGRLEDGFIIVCPTGESPAEREILGIIILEVPTISRWTLSEPATFNQARIFEESVIGG